MEGFDPRTSFGPDVARRYDHHPRGDEPETVDFLASLAGDGAALELAIGTGRIALPLAARGIRVDGVELSPDMVARLREKRGGMSLDVVLGDMATAAAPASSYRLIYLVYNTIFNLLTQDDQTHCFENVARHLARDGVFVMEAGVPTAWLRGGQFVDVERVTNDEVVLDVNRYDPVTQVLSENHLTFTNGGVHLRPIACRLATPAELDLMARLAGLRLVDRWGGWQGEPFTALSDRHVSTYGW
ncbi:MAG: class I SAM-dependent methyltransferase [Actinomycetota bacterium]|nr:class I SAM-dependent methyltransferase [Actinomycetota bacterium]